MREQSSVSDASRRVGGAGENVGFINSLLPDEIGVESIERLDGEGFNLVVDDGASCLAEARENAFDDDLVAFLDFHLSEADDFYGSRRVFQQESIGRLTLSVGCELDIGNL